MMKKSLLAAALLGIVAASGAQAAPAAAAPSADKLTVTFSGEVKQPTCNVTVNTANNKVDLGTIPLQPTAKGSAIPVVFKLTGCNETTVTTIAFTGGSRGESPADGKLKTNQDNVIVKLANGDDESSFSTEFVPEVRVAQKVGTGFEKQVFFARLQADNGTPKAGLINASGLFTVSYQ